MIRNELLRKFILPVALTVGLGHAATADAYDGHHLPSPQAVRLADGLGVSPPEPQLGPATREEYTHKDITAGQIERFRVFVNDVLRYSEAATERELVNRDPSGNLVKDDYTLYQTKRYNAFGKRTSYQAHCILTRHINMKLVPDVKCVVPPSSLNEKPPEVVYLVDDSGDRELVPVGGVAWAA